MIAEFKPCTLHGSIDAPPSKSMAHRYIIASALSGKSCTLTGVDFSEDILASIDCIRALGADVAVNNDTLTVLPQDFMKVEHPVLNCRESGSTLRFLIPLALCLGTQVSFEGSERLLSRPLSVYEDLCAERGFEFFREENLLTVCGNLTGGSYKIRGDISSQFITGLIFALVYLNEPSTLKILPPFDSRPYVELTLAALNDFGACVCFSDEYTVKIDKSAMHSITKKIEGDYSNAAALDAFNYLGSSVVLENLNRHSLQGDKIYKDYFDKIECGTPTLDISDCPDLGPVLIALAAMKNGVHLTGTDRLKIKESDRGAAMHQELSRLGGGLVFGNNEITVPKQKLRFSGETLCGHNDHRIVMAMSLILSRIGGKIAGAEAVRKSYPRFFEDIKSLGAEVNTYDS